MGVAWGRSLVHFISCNHNNVQLIVVYHTTLQGSAFTAIEPENGVNDLCQFADSGLLFLATEDSKMLVYYIPVRVTIFTYLFKSDNV